MAWQASGEVKRNTELFVITVWITFFPHEAVELQERLPRETEQSVVTWVPWWRRVTADTASYGGLTPGVRWMVAFGHRSIAKALNQATVAFSHVLHNKQKWHLFMANWVKVDCCRWCQVTSKTLFNLNIKNPAWRLELGFQKWYLPYTFVPLETPLSPHLMSGHFSSDAEVPSGISCRAASSSPSLGLAAGCVRHVASQVPPSLPLETLGSCASSFWEDALKGAKWGLSRPRCFFLLCFVCLLVCWVFCRGGGLLCVLFWFGFCWREWLLIP